MAHLIPLHGYLASSSNTHFKILNRGHIKQSVQQLVNNIVVF